MYLTERDRQRISDAVQADSEFLRDQGIMDYSLLLGVCMRPFRTGDASRGMGDSCGSSVQSSVVVGAGTYFIGIIDILQKWNWKKRLERYWKLVLGKDGRGLSAVEPGFYQSRFRSGIEQILAVPREVDEMLQMYEMAAQCDP